MMLSGLILALLAHTVYSATNTAPTVSTDNGVVIGQYQTAYETNKPYYAYYGIPFAKPPVGRRRFKAPEPFTSDNPNERINSDSFRDRCPQKPGVLGLPSSEDCLYLNVYTPARDSGNFENGDVNKVFVYLHGGYFESGESSSWPPSNWVTDYNVIVVVIAYRVGAFGFLSSGDARFPGNYGLLDQIMALQWVQDNIHLFGGDACDVTLYGTAAGSVGASILSISPLTTGLFTKVILDGGFSLSPWGIDRRAVDTFDSLVDLVNCKPGPEENLREGSRRYRRYIAKCLRNVEATTIVSTLTDELKGSHEEVLSMEGHIFFGPVVDGNVLPKDPFELLADPVYLSQVGTLDRKYIIGVSNNEALMWGIRALHNPNVPYEALVNPDHEVAQQIIRNNYLSVMNGLVSQEILDFTSFMYYYPRDANGNSNIQSSVDFMSDVDFIVPGVLLARALTNASSDVDVYHYLLDHYPTLTDPNFPFHGCTHGLSVVFTFDANLPLGTLLYFQDIKDEVSRPVFDVLRSAFSNFAKYGEPSPDWRRYDLQNEYYYAVGPQPELRSHMFHRRVSLWTDFLPNKFHAYYTRARGWAAPADF